MSTPYERAKGGRLTFKGGTLATRSKSIDKKHKKKKIKPSHHSDTGGANSIQNVAYDDADEIQNVAYDDADEIQNVAYEEAMAAAVADEADGGGGGGDGVGADKDLYTIDAAKKMKYEELFPVEARKFGYDPKFKAKTVEGALDDRVKKKADRYCK